MYVQKSLEKCAKILKSRLILVQNYVIIVNVKEKVINLCIEIRLKN